MQKFKPESKYKILESGEQINGHFKENMKSGRYYYRE